MVEYTTYDDLRSFGRTVESAELMKSVQVRNSVGHNTFLSHSTKDQELLPGVVAILEAHGADVYIDKKDETLPPYTTRKTATILRKNIKAARKFVLFATPNSKDSRWVPWELGLSDGYKTDANIAIFPAAEYSYQHSWSEQEYLGIYDRIVWGKLAGYSNELWMVYDHEENTAVTLRNWLSR
jgi:hypothetical protein